MTHPFEEEHHEKHEFTINVVSGLLSGLASALFFIPFDRALYLSVLNSRAFLLKENFRSPYQGFLQTIVQSTYCQGSYFVCQGEFNASLLPYLHRKNFNEDFSKFLIGLLSGGLYAILNNPLNAIKHYTWTHHDRTFVSSVREMSSQGLKPFFTGTYASGVRDAIWGGCYESLRCMMKTHLPSYHLKSYSDFVYNMLAASLATIASTPFNYARSMQYGTPVDVRTPTITEVLQKLWFESQSHSGFSRFSCIQDRLKVGWATARVGFGIALGQCIADQVHSYLRTYPMRDQMYRQPE